MTPPHDKLNEPVSLETDNDEIYRKIGRNLVLFQRLERLLKIIVGNSEVSGPVSHLCKPMIFSNIIGKQQWPLNTTYFNRIA